MSAFRFYYRGTKETGNLSLRIMHGDLDSKLKTPYQSKREYWIYRSTKNGKNINKLKKLDDLRGSDEIKQHKAELIEFREKLENQLRIDLNNGLPITKEWFKNAIKVHSVVLNNPIEISEAQKEINRKARRVKEIQEKNILLNAIKESYSKYQSNFDEQKKYKTTHNWVQDYQNYKSEQSKKEVVFKVSDFNQGFVDDFKHWAIKIMINKLSTVLGHLKRIKKAVKYAESIEEEGVVKLHRKIEELSFSTKREREEINDKIVIRLSFKEFDRIDDLDFSDNPKLQEVQKCMLIGSETGLRFTDFGKLNDENLKTSLNGVSYWEFKTSKTKKWVQITKTDRLAYFLEKYGNPKTEYSDNEDIELNKRMKEICRIANINELTEMEINRAIEVKGKQVRRHVKDIFPKYKGITTRTLRRSFATNYYGLLPSDLIMRVTGHSNLKSLKEYINVHEDSIVEESFNKINAIHKQRKEGLRKVN